MNDVGECQWCGRQLQQRTTQCDSTTVTRVKLRKVLKQTLRDAEECVLWRMPTYRSEKGNIIHFAAATKHTGLYPGYKAVNAFLDRLKDYKSHKGSIQFQNDEPLPLDLISEIAKWSYETGNHH